ncbi:MAG: hypothetical protein ACYTBJ_15095 [Planctomycetota bacterium]|jgi:hypothetical protein
MANPVFVNLTADVWTKIATDVTNGIVWFVDRSPMYLHAYVETGGAAPTVAADGVEVSDDENVMPISSVTGIDVYIYPKGSAGRVRVDL